MTKHPEERLGELYVMSFVLLGAFWPIGVNYGAKNLPPMQFLGVMMLASSLLFLMMTWYHGQFHALLQRKWLIRTTLYSLLITLGYVLVVTATRFTSATDTTLLLQSEIVFAAIVGVVLMGEHLNRSRLLGIGFVLLADFATLYKTGLEVNIPHLVLFFAPLCYVFANRMSRSLQFEGLHWAPMLFFRHFFAGIVVLLFSLQIEGWQSPAPSQWLFMVTFGLVIYGLNKIFWQLAQVRLDLSKATALGLTHPIFSFILARLFLGEVPSFQQLVGIAASMIGIFFLVRSTSRRWSTAD